jgi:oxygen-independent coproporphyrinogen-3 oxidase
MLTYEAGTPMDAQRLSGAIIPLGDDKVARMFEVTSDFLRKRGYEHYEISNFARRSSSNDFRSRHNRKYWNSAVYHGFGPSAHSFDGTRRSWNLRDVRGYISVLKNNRLPISETEELSMSQRRLEMIYLGLRQRRGIDLKTFEKRFGDSLVLSNQNLLKQLRQEKMVVYDSKTLRLTLRGMCYLDSIVALID